MTHGPSTTPAVRAQVEVRLARPDEMGQVGALTVSAYVYDGHLAAGDEYAGQLRDAASRGDLAELWVAVTGERVVGTVTFCPPGSPYRELARTGEGEFRMLAVDPGERGRGIAGTLVDRCMSRCRELQLRRIVICSMAQMHSAHALYASFGFARAESLDWEPVPGVVLWGFSRDL